MKRRLPELFTALCLAFVLAGCGDSKSGGSSGDADSSDAKAVAQAVMDAFAEEDFETLAEHTKGEAKEDFLDFAKKGKAYEEYKYTLYAKKEFKEMMKNTVTEVRYERRPEKPPLRSRSGHGEGVGRQARLCRSAIRRRQVVLGRHTNPLSERLPQAAGHV